VTTGETAGESSAPVAARFVREPGRLERLAAERQARDLELASKPGGHPEGFRYVPELGDRVIAFVEGFCRHHKGEWAGQQLVLEPWQKEMLRNVFGWLRADGTRRFRTLYLEIPRKNGKSEIAGALALYLMIADDEPGAEVYVSATKKDQAKITWDAAAAMVKKSPDLKRFARVLKNNISVERTESKCEPLGADSDTLDGLNPHGNVVDELHAHKDRGLWDVLDTAMGARRQPMTIAITTAGTFDKESIGWQQHDHAVKVLEGTIPDDTFYALIFTCDEPSDENREYYFTEQAWATANPNYGVSVKPTYLRDQAAKAQKQPSFFNTFLRLHLDVWTRVVTRWLSVEDWAKTEALVVDPRAAALEREKSLEGLACFGGLDLSAKIDLTAFVLAFPRADRFVDVVCRFWMPKGTIVKELSKKQVHWDTWARQGWLTETPGNVIDYDWIIREVKALRARFNVQQIAYDPWNATSTATALMNDGVAMVECGQGYKSLSEPSKELDARIVDHKIRHAHNPILSYCVANAAKSEDAAGNVKPDKSESSGRIDGVVSLVMALGRLIVTPVEERPFQGGLRQL
jgi:phage terminase large subunit-like protein